MVVSPPGIFRTITFGFPGRYWGSHLAYNRPAMSVPPPGAKGTTKVTVFPAKENGAAVGDEVGFADGLGEGNGAVVGFDVRLGEGNGADVGFDFGVGVGEGVGVGVAQANRRTRTRQNKPDINHRFLLVIVMPPKKKWFGFRKI